jgi:hypothetical protein
MFCTHGKTDTHNTASCYKLKKIARDKAEAGKARDKEPYSKRTFRKEVNAIARRAGKHGGIKLVEKAIKRKQVKQAKHAKKHEKVWRVRKRLLNLTWNLRKNPCTIWNPGSLVKRQSLLKMFV